MQKIKKMDNNVNNINFSTGLKQPLVNNGMQNNYYNPNQDASSIYANNVTYQPNTSHPAYGGRGHNMYNFHADKPMYSGNIQGGNLTTTVKSAEGDGCCCCCQII
jgi:hypothetical protein